MLSSANSNPDGVGWGHMPLIDIIQPGNVGSQGDKMDITWQCVMVQQHINAVYLCSIMKCILKIGHNYKNEQGKCNAEDAIKMSGKFRVVLASIDFLLFLSLKLYFNLKHCIKSAGWMSACSKSPFWHEEAGILNMLMQKQ